MIGGHDVVLPAFGDSASLEGCIRIIGRYWPDARLEDAVTAEKYRRVGDVPFGRVRELLVYPDADAEKAWDADDPNAAENSMLYLIVRSEDVTVVLDNPDTAEMHSILNAIENILRTDLLFAYSRAA